MSQSVPVSFLKTGFQVFLKGQNIDFSNISGIMGLLLLPWTLKLFWAPLVDRYGNKRIGHRKSWIIPLQVLGAVVLVTAAFLPLESHLMQVTLLFLIYSFICATQDIAVDGLAVLTLSKKEHGVGNSIQMGGYYLGELLGGAIILILFEKFGWTASILCLAAFFLLPLISVFPFKEPKREVVYESNKSFWSDISGYFKQENGWWILLLFIYMGNQILARTLLPGLLKDLNMSEGEIGWLIGIWGNSASLAGAVLGGFCINWIGRRNALMYFGLLKIPAFLLILLLNNTALEMWQLKGIVMINDFTAGLATVALFTVMMDKCRLDYPGTDFSIQQSFNSIGVLIFVILSGILLDSAGLNGLIYTSVTLGFLSVLIVWKKMRPDNSTGPL